MSDLEPIDVGPAVGGDRTISDDDRQHVLTLLTSAHAEGLLDTAERDRRLAQARDATIFDDLVPLTRDLVEATATRRTAPGTGQPQITAIFGAAERRGYWKVPSQLSVSAVFGGVELDLTDAAFESTEISLDVRCIFGGVELTVPEGTEVSDLTNAAFGGCTIKVGPPRPGGIHLTLTGTLAFGGAEVRNPSASAIRRAQREIHRKQQLHRRELRRHDQLQQRELRHEQQRERRREQRELRRRENCG